MIAQQFDKLLAHIPGPAQWRDEYTVDVVSDDGAITTFKLVPLKKGNVDRVQATVDEKPRRSQRCAGTTTTADLPR